MGAEGVLPWGEKRQALRGGRDGLAKQGKGIVVPLPKSL